MARTIIESWTISNLDWAIAAGGNPTRIHFRQPMDLTDKDYLRIETLARCDAGSGHDCWLKGVGVTVNLFTTQNIHRHLLRYHWCDVVSSMSLEYNIEEVINSDFLMQNIDPALRDLMRAKVDSGVDRMWLLDNIGMGVLLGMSIRTNYLQLKTMYNQRKHHRNPGWKPIIEWIEQLPRMENILK